MSMLRVVKYRLLIPAGSASPGPPLGPILGQKGINISAFVKEFNQKSAFLKQGLETIVEVYQEGRNYKMDIISPTTASLLKSAAGVQKGSADSKIIVGEICLKKVYEIAKMKQKDPFLMYHDLKSICIKVIKQANNMGIRVVPHKEATLSEKTVDQINFDNYYFKPKLN